MAGTIAPLVKAAPRTWAAATSLCVLGNLLGAISLGLLVSLAGQAASPAISGSPLAWGVAAALGIVYALWQIGVLKARLPWFSRHETTPRSWWTALGPYRASLLWGVQIGFGVTTVVPYATYYFLLICLLLAGDPLLGARVLATYGLARALPTVVAAIPIARGVPPRVASEWADAPS